jgi:hypothetical protein
MLLEDLESSLNFQQFYLVDGNITRRSYENDWRVSMQEIYLKLFRLLLAILTRSLSAHGHSQPSMQFIHLSFSISNYPGVSKHVQPYFSTFARPFHGQPVGYTRAGPLHC